MQKLSQDDLHFVVRRIPKDIRELVQSRALLIGGGFIRETIAGNTINDIDLFGVTDEQLQGAAEAIATSREGSRKFSTNNAITVLAPPRTPLQFITRWKFAEPSKLVESFDFTVCQAVVWFNAGEQAWESLIGDRFYQDLAARRLVYTFPVRDEEAGGSMLRVRKFLTRGYNIQASSLAGVIARVAGGVHSWTTLDERERARVVTGLLHEVDPLAVIDGIEPIAEHDPL